MAKAAKVKAEAAPEATPVPIVSYKGFDKNLQCRGFQFEIGTAFTSNGRNSPWPERLVKSISVQHSKLHCMRLTI